MLLLSFAHCTCRCGLFVTAAASVAGTTGRLLTVVCVARRWVASKCPAVLLPLGAVLCCAVWCGVSAVPESQAATCCAPAPASDEVLALYPCVEADFLSWKQLQPLWRMATAKQELPPGSRKSCYVLCRLWLCINWIAVQLKSHKAFNQDCDRSRFPLLSILTARSIQTAYHASSSAITTYGTATVLVWLGAAMPAKQQQSAGPEASSSTLLEAQTAAGSHKGTGRGNWQPSERRSVQSNYASACNLHTMGCQAGSSSGLFHLAAHSSQVMLLQTLQPTANVSQHTNIQHMPSAAHTHALCCRCRTPALTLWPRTSQLYAACRSGLVPLALLACWSTGACQG